MKVWLTQRAEPTPHDQGEQRRPMRTGLMAEYLSSQGDDVLWWTGDYDHFGQRQRGHSEREKQIPGSYRIIYLNAKGYKKTVSLARLRYDRKIALAFTALAPKSKRPDVIVASMPSVDLALSTVQFGLKQNIPVVVDIRDLHPDIFIDTAPKLLKPFFYGATRTMEANVRKLCRGATAIWGNSDNFVEWACNKAGRSKTHLDHTFPITYKPMKIEKQKTQCIVNNWRRLGLFNENDVNIVFFGSLSNSFDFSLLFDAAKRLLNLKSNCKFHFFGAGSQESYIKAQCEVLQNCHYFGPVGASRLQAAMVLSDIGIAPYIKSKNYIHNMPNKPTEYLGGGLIVALSLNEGILADFLQKTGAGFSYQTSFDLSEKLLSIENNPVQITRAKNSVKIAFKKYLSYEIISQQVRDKLQSIVSEYQHFK